MHSSASALFSKCRGETDHCHLFFDRTRHSRELDTDLLVDKLRNMSHLSTITENSPYSTHMGSRRNSHHPTAAGIFETKETIPEATTDQGDSNSDHTVVDETVKSSHNSKIFQMSGNSSDCPYYPMDSEASRPFTPRFLVGGEEVSSNYEPVLVTNREFAVSPVLGRSPMGRSPILPKRLARMELDAINNKRPFSQQEKLPDVPEVRVSQEGDCDQEEEDVEEVFEEIGTPKEEDLVEEGETRSAFDNMAATFYV